MKEPKISIIVPVFNTIDEKYFKKCLESLRCQTYSNLEIICTTNGLTDGIRQVCEEYRQLDSRIKMISQDNNDIYTALNNGIYSSDGEYISFVKSEDWVLLNLYRTFVDIISKLHCDTDIYMFNSANFTNNKNDVVPRLSFGIEDWKKHNSDLTIHTFKDCKKPFTKNMEITNKIYLKSFLTDKNLLFTGLKCACETFCLQSFLRASSIVINKNIFYRSRNIDLITSENKYFPEVFDVFKGIDLIEKEIMHKGLYQNYKYAFFQYKFNSYFKQYKHCPEKLKEAYFNEMKYRLLSAATTDLDKQITVRLKNYGIFEDIKNCSRKKFDELYKTYQSHK